MGKYGRSLLQLAGFAIFFAFAMGCGGGGGGDNELAGNPNFVRTLELIDAAYSLAYDGSNFWFAEDEDVMYEMTPQGSIIGSFDLFPYGAGRGAAWDGSNLWVVNDYNCASVTTFLLYSTATGTVIDSINGTDDPKINTTLRCAFGLAYLNSILYTISGGDKVHLVDAVSKSLLAFSVAIPTASPNSTSRLTFAGSDLWVAEDPGGTEVTFHHLDLVSGTFLKSVQGQGETIHGLTWDGTNLWAATWYSPPGFHAWDVY